ncbi:MAG: type II toxin-antitoxin system Phd/YefM family antitoxin [Spirochaetaceae bacterium]
MEIAAGQFKAQCLKLMDHVRDTHERIVVTKHGRPVAQMVSLHDGEKPTPVFGRMRGLLTAGRDLIAPTGEFPGGLDSG